MNDDPKLEFLLLSFISNLSKYLDGHFMKFMGFHASDIYLPWRILNLQGIIILADPDTNMHVKFSFTIKSIQQR